ncbi:lipoprotein N-acyltransferase Lnb domain-containing protein [Tateyamaria pelophila]|uniref:lipoprotein N-acyltransferase Lnb domain-containing protein n=1 Tax=Tateyamaria pelophila TaxID=328415 RepID=UPI001CBBF71D|nr:DUF4105 domain-containing protein [Tateyamaria pelophila]
MKKIARFILLFILFVAVAYATLWASMAFWFKLPGPDLVRWCVMIAFGLLGVGTLIAIFKTVRWRWLSVFAISMLAIVVWWNTLIPPVDGNWPADVSRQVTGTIDGDILTLHNVRAFNWRTAEDFTEKWVTRTYDLSTIDSADIFLSFWAGPSMAHFMLSFGFEDGRYVTFSNEVRRSIGGSFSPVADFFKANPIIMIASEEYDIVGLRSNVRKERVQLFRLKTDAAQRREYVEAYVSTVNELAEKPRWFNSAFTNCSSTAILLARHIGAQLPTDWRLLINGYMPEYLYERGALDTNVTLEELFLLGDVTERATAVGLNEGYSAAIREGVPAP